MIARTILVALAAAPLTAQLGTFTTSGTGCPTPNAPSLSIDQPPVIGSAPTVTCDSLPLDTVISVLFVGSTPVSVPLDVLLGAPGCTGYVAGIFASPTMTLTAPTAITDIVIPNAAALTGFTMEMQTLGLSVSAGWVASDRGTMTVGDGVPVLLRDATCWPNTACTAAANPIASSMGTLQGGSYDSSPFYFTVQRPTALTSFRGVGNGTGAVTFSSYQWVVNVWSATQTQSVEQAWMSSPNNGNVVDQELLTESHQSFGTGYLVNLAPQAGQIGLPPGDYLIAVAAVGSPAWFWHETTVNLGSDIVNSNSFPTGAYYSYTSFPPYATGSQALDVFGY